MEQGQEVSDILMIDSSRIMKKRSISEEKINQTVQENLLYFRKRMENDEDYRVFVHNEFVQSLLIRKMGRFIRYLYDTVNHGMIHANIHLILSGAGETVTGGWEEVTTGIVKSYRGVGDHPDMTDERNLERNGRVIAEILTGIVHHRDTEDTKP
jgi:thioesterase domain-containing protein